MSTPSSGGASTGPSPRSGPDDRENVTLSGSNPDETPRESLSTARGATLSPSDALMQSTASDSSQPRKPAVTVVSVPPEPQPPQPHPQVTLTAGGDPEDSSASSLSPRTLLPGFPAEQRAATRSSVTSTTATRKPPPPQPAVVVRQTSDTPSGMLGREESATLRQQTTGAFTAALAAEAAAAGEHSDDEEAAKAIADHARLEKRVNIIMHIKRFFLVYHIVYILLVAVVCSGFIFHEERGNPDMSARTTYFIDAFFVAVSGVTCTGLMTLNAQHFSMTTVIIWHVAVFLGSTVFTSIAPSVLRIETLKLLRKLEADNMTELRKKHISRLLRSSRIMVVVTFAYAFVFFAIGMVLMGPNLGFGDGLLRTISAFGNAGFITDPPRNFDTHPINVVAVLIVVPAGSTLFPVFLRPFTLLCSLVWAGYIRLATRFAPTRRVLGDPEDWMMEVETAVVAAQKRVDVDGQVAFVPVSPEAEAVAAAAAREVVIGGSSPPMMVGSLPSETADLIGRRASGGLVNGRSPDTDERTALLARDPVSGGASGYGTEHGIGGASVPDEASDTERLMRAAEAAAAATASFRNETTEVESEHPTPEGAGAPMFTGLQNLSMLLDDDVKHEVENRRVRRNGVAKGFTAILTSSKPVNHHPWLFVAADATYLLIAWSLVVLFQFLPLTFQQWDGYGVLADQESDAMKVLVGWTQSAINRFSGITFFDFNRLSPGQITTIVFALYLPALPIPTHRTHRKWKEMFSGGFFRLMLSRFFWLFVSTLAIVFIEDGHAFKGLDGFMYRERRYDPRLIDDAHHGHHQKLPHAQSRVFHNGKYYQVQFVPEDPNDDSPTASGSIIEQAFQAGAPAISPIWTPRNGTYAHGVLTRTLFEVLSAYATAGVSLPLPESPAASLSSSFMWVSKVIIIVCMLAGRHRGVDLGLDIGLTDMAATEKRDPDRAKRTEHDFDLGALERSRRRSIVVSRRTPTRSSVGPFPAGETDQRFPRREEDAASEASASIRSPVGMVLPFGSVGRRDATERARQERRSGSRSHARSQSDVLATRGNTAALVDGDVPSLDASVSVPPRSPTLET